MCGLVRTTARLWRGAEIKGRMATVPILFASRSTFQKRNSSRSTIVALIPKARICIFGCFYLTVFFKLLVFYRIATARIIFRILNRLLMTAVLTTEGVSHLGMLSIKFYFIPNVVFSTNFREIRNYINRKQNNKKHKVRQHISERIQSRHCKSQNVIHIHLLF